MDWDDQWKSTENEEIRIRSDADFDFDALAARFVRGVHTKRADRRTVGHRRTDSGRCDSFARSTNTSGGAGKT